MLAAAAALGERYLAAMIWISRQPIQDGLSIVSTRMTSMPVSGTSGCERSDRVLQSHSYISAPVASGHCLGRCLRRPLFLGRVGRQELLAV